MEAAQAARDEAAQKVENGELTEEELAGYEQALAQAQAELEAVNGALAQAQESLNACQQAAAQKTELEANLSAANAGVETLQAKDRTCPDFGELKCKSDSNRRRKSEVK